MNIPAPAKKTFIGFTGLSIIGGVLTTQLQNIYILGGCAIVGIVTCYCVYIQHKTDIIGKGKNA